MRQLRTHQTKTFFTAAALVISLAFSPHIARGQSEPPLEPAPPASTETLPTPAGGPAPGAQDFGINSAAAADAVLTVNTDADLDVANAECSLREAIIAANTNAAYHGCPAGSGAGTDTIQFANAIVQINLTSELPTITERVRVDGFTGAGNRVRLSAAVLVANADVFQIASDDVAISSLQIYNLAPGGGRAIYVQSGADSAIFFNFVGVTEAATSCDSGGVTRASNYGVALGSASSAATVYGNVIGCNTAAGIFVNGSDNHRIGLSGVSNQIGIKDDVAVPNNIGVWLNNAGADGASNNVVRNNRIAGNVGDGIRISGTGTNDWTSSTANTVIANRIGFKSNGADPLQNGDHGVRLVDGAYLNRVGGPDDEDRNVISGNEDDGVLIDGSNYNTVLGNFIGVTITGTEKLINFGRGVRIVNGDYNTVGCTSLCATVKGNRIGGGFHGIEVSGGSQNTIAGNLIGFAPGGTFGTDIGATNAGVVIHNGATRTSVGSAGNAAWANTIAYNGTVGVRVQGSTTTTNTIGINTIFANERQGVAFFDGAHANVVKGTTITLNGDDAPFGKFDGIFEEAGLALGLGNRWSQVSIGGNQGLGIDVLSAAESDNVVTNPGVTFAETKLVGPNVVIKGTVAPVTFTGVREVEVYEVAWDESGFGEGLNYVGTDTLDANGDFEFSFAGDQVKCYTAFVTYLPSGGGDDHSTEFSRSSCGVALPLVTK